MTMIAAVVRPKFGVLAADTRFFLEDGGALNEHAASLVHRDGRGGSSRCGPDGQQLYTDAGELRCHMPAGELVIPETQRKVRPLAGGWVAISSRSLQDYRALEDLVERDPSQVEHRIRRGHDPAAVGELREGRFFVVAAIGGRIQFRGYDFDGAPWSVPDVPKLSVLSGVPELPDLARELDQATRGRADPDEILAALADVFERAAAVSPVVSGTMEVGMVTPEGRRVFLRGSPAEVRRGDAALELV